MDQALVNSVTRQVKHQVPKHIDHEDLALEILFSSWLNKIDIPSPEFISQKCRNACRNWNKHYAKLGRYKSTMSQPSPSEEVANNDEVEARMAILSKLERKLIWHRFYQELTLEELAEAMRLPLNLCRDTLHLALLKMRSAL